MIAANAAEFNNWIARNKPGNDGLGYNGESKGNESF